MSESTYGKHLTPRLKHVLLMHLLACPSSTEMFKAMIGDLIQEIMERRPLQVEIDEARELAQVLILWFPDQTRTPPEEILWDQLSPYQR